MEPKAIVDEKFAGIYRAYKDSIYKTAMYYTKDEYTAQDMAQQAFFQLYTHFDNVDMEYVEPWLIRTVRNLAFNYNRDCKREMLGEVMDVIMETEADDCKSESLDEYYVRKEQKERAKDLSDSIFERLYKKNPQWYHAITLVYCLDKTHEEVAEEMGITAEVLSSRLYRAKKWIRKNYEKEFKKAIDWL